MDYTATSLNFDRLAETINTTSKPIYMSSSVTEQLRRNLYQFGDTAPFRFSWEQEFEKNYECHFGGEKAEFKPYEEEIEVSDELLEFLDDIQSGGDKL